jgi:hypothetical protein
VLGRCTSIHAQMCTDTHAHVCPDRHGETGMAHSSTHTHRHKALSRSLTLNRLQITVKITFMYVELQACKTMIKKTLN